MWPLAYLDVFRHLGGWHDVARTPGKGTAFFACFWTNVWASCVAQMCPRKSLVKINLLACFKVGMTLKKIWGDFFFSCGCHSEHGAKGSAWWNPNPPAVPGLWSLL